MKNAVRIGIKLVAALTIAGALSVTDIRAHEEKTDWSYPPITEEAEHGPVYGVDWPGVGAAREFRIGGWHCLLIGDRWSFDSHCRYTPPVEPLRVTQHEQN